MLLFPVQCALMNSEFLPSTQQYVTLFHVVPQTVSIKVPVKLMQIIGLAIEVPSRNSLRKGCGRYVHVYLIIHLHTLHRKAIVPIPLSFSLAVFLGPIMHDFIPKMIPPYNSCNIYACISSIVTHYASFRGNITFGFQTEFLVLITLIRRIRLVQYLLSFLRLYTRRTLFAEFCKNLHACHLHPPRYSI
jgi:hypothetical protein